MAANSNDLFKKLARKWTGSIGSGGVADSTVATIPLASTTNLPTDTAVVAVIDRVDANGTATPSLEESVIGVVSGNNLVTCTRGVEGTAQAHSAGAVVEILFTNKGWEDLIDGILVEHDQDGTHKSATVTTLKATGAEIDTGTEDAKIVTPKAIADSIIKTGWTPARETWTYASASTITVPAGATAKYQKGDKIKLTQTTVKYFYIIGVADTLLTITGGTDYTLADADITDNYYSKAESPQGFPDYFNWTPICSGSGSMTWNATASVARFAIHGSTLFWILYANGTTSGTASNVLKVTPPIDPDYIYRGGCSVRDSSFLVGFFGREPDGFYFYKYDISNYGIGSNRGAAASGSYFF